MNKSLSELKTDFEVYQYIKNHLLSQGVKSETTDGFENNFKTDAGCAYRGDDNKKCAVGWIIADEYYDYSLEGKACHQKEVLDAVEKSVPRWIVNPSMLQNMQYIHDEIEPDEWYLMLEDMIRYFPNRDSFLQCPEETGIE
jgi:hypothetical protein